MKTNKGVALSLAAVILASGVGIGASAAVAAPTVPVTQSVTAKTSTIANSSVVRVSAPFATTSKIGYDRATVSWKKPVVIGSITSYRVSVIHGGKIVKTYNLKPSALTQTVTGLKEQAYYQVIVEVSASSQDGKKTVKASNYTSLTTATSPASMVRISPVTNIKLTSGTSSVAASWNKPTAITGKLVNYTVIISEGTKVVKKFNTTSEKANFTGLKRHTPYSVVVEAHAVSANGKYKSGSTWGKYIFTR